MVCGEPLAVSAAVMQVATPEPLSATKLQPLMVVEVSWKVTVPVGTPPPGAVAVTVAVKVTDCPKTVGPLVTTLTEVAAFCTICEVEFVDELKLVSPP